MEITEIVYHTLPCGGNIEITTGQCLFFSNGKWYRAGNVSPSTGSMIEAMNTAMLGGITIHDMSYIFGRYGTTLGKCFNQNPQAVLEFLTGKLENLGRIEDGESNHQYRDDLVGVIERQTQPDQGGLLKELKKMIAICEERMQSAGIALDEQYYKETAS